MTVREFWAIAKRVARRFCGVCLWMFAPMATSVKGALDRNDFRPVIAKMIVLAGVAGAGIETAFHDPEVMGAAAVLAIAVLSGLLEAVSRMNQGGSTAPPPVDPPGEGSKLEGAPQDAAPRP
jgi:hypothetical protein